MEQDAFKEIPENFIKKWQEIADFLAKIINVPAALIMKTENEFMEVFISSETENNPYKVGDKEHWHGLYCETVIKTQKELLIPNALKDKNWDKNPDLKLGMLAYLGLPINFPDNRPFGTLCVLNNKEHKFTPENEKLLKQFKNVIELDLALIQTLDLKKEADNSEIIKKLYHQNEEYLVINEELEQSNNQLYEEEQRLNESKNELNRFFDLVPDMVCIASADGYFKRLNSMWEKVLGFSIEELKSKPLAEFIHPDDVEPTFKEIENQLNNQSTANFINRYRCKTGEYKWFDWVAIPSPDGENLYAAARDITEKKQIDNELIKAKEKTEESEKNLRFLFENMVQGVVYHKPTGDIIRANEAAARILGLSLDQLYGKTSLDPRWKSIHEDGTEYPGETHPVMVTIKTKKPVRNAVMGVFIPEKNGYSWININSIPQFNDENELIQVVVTFEDITDKKKMLSQVRTEKELADKAQKRLQSIIRVAPTGIGLVKNREIIEVNEFVCEMLGYKPEELIGRDASILYPTIDDYEYVGKEKYRQIAKRGTGSLETQWQKKNGEILDILMASTPLDMNDLSKGVTFTAVNITPIKNTQKELITAKEKAEKTGRILHEKNQEYEALNEELNQTNEELYAAKEKAEESEENWQTTFDAIEDIVMLLSTDHKIIEINKAGIDALRLPKEKIIGEKCFHLVHKTSEPILECPCEISMQEKKTIKKEYTEDNRIYELTAYPVCDENDEITHFTHIVKDITEEKLKEAKISGLSKIIENSLNEIYIFDKNSLKYKFANKGALRNIGYSMDELKTLTPANLKPEFSPKQFQKLISPLINRESEIITTETIHQRKDGSRYDVEISLQSAEYDNTEVFVVFTSDITKRKKHEQEVNRQKKLFETMFNTIPEGIVITNTKREIVLANEGMQTTFGYKPEELIGQKTKVFYADIEKFENAGTQVFNKEATPAEKNYQTYYKYKNGNIFPGETFGAKLYDEQGEWIGNIGIMRDITEREKFIDDLKEAKQKAEENSRLKTAFLNNLSHEIRTPLNAICGFSSMLDSPNISENKRKNFVSIINNSSDQLLAIVSDVLTMSSIETNLESPDMEAVNINEIMNELLSIFKQQAANRDISVYSKKELSDRQSVVYTDKTKLTQILSNLISNALKFTHEGFVEFGYEYVEQRRGVALPHSELQFFVKDSGIGIHPDLHDKIFEQFRQADQTIQQNYGGTGLGLSISKGFAELLGGKIWLESEVGEGTTFYFTIPYKPANVDDETEPSVEPKKTLGNATILIAEDEEFNYMYLEELLIDFDYTLIHAKNGQEAIDIYETNPDISLILMDIKMPIMDGHTAAKLIKKQKPDLPIIAQSAYALEHERAKYEGVFDDYLTKPISEDDLIEKVSKYIESK